MPGQAERVDYPELLRALGYFIQREHLAKALADVLEFDDRLPQSHCPIIGLP